MMGLETEANIFFGGLNASIDSERLYNALAFLGNNSVAN